MAKKKDPVTKPRVLVALTAQRFVFSRTAFCLIQAAMNTTDYEFDFIMEVGCEISSARNRLAQAAIDRNCTHLLFVDYDMYFTKDTIPSLIKADKDIIGATYNFRQETLKSTAVPEGMASSPHPDDLPKEPFKCEAIGTGLMLIKTDVFKKMAKPHFMFGFEQDGTVRFGEDTYFCQMAKAAGFEVWADPTLNVKHIGEHLF